MLAIVLLMGGLLAMGSCQPTRRTPVRAVDELRELLRTPTTTPARPRVPAAPRIRRPRPPRPPRPSVELPRWAS